MDGAALEVAALVEEEAAATGADAPCPDVAGMKAAQSGGRDAAAEEPEGGRQAKED